jgi:hypothetical protein
MINEHQKLICQKQFQLVRSIYSHILGTMAQDTTPSSDKTYFLLVINVHKPKLIHIKELLCITHDTDQFSYQYSGNHKERIIDKI